MTVDAEKLAQSAEREIQVFFSFRPVVREHGDIVKLGRLSREIKSAEQVTTQPRPENLVRVEDPSIPGMPTGPSGFGGRLLLL
jgi:hypothetical protein